MKHNKKKRFKVILRTVLAILLQISIVLNLFYCVIVSLSTRVKNPELSEIELHSSIVRDHPIAFIFLILSAIVLSLKELN